LRTESRGAHQRADYPDTAAEWQCTILVQPLATAAGLRMELSTAAIAPPSPEVAEAIDEAEYEVAGRLVE
jgi:succinate dehydrogenase / fumarate reductase, flavoprotein subunit